MKPRITLVAAADLDGVIGRDNGLPWRLPADLAHFKKTTMGKPVIMGRRTLASIGDKPLPGRETVVLSRSPVVVDNVHSATTLDEAVAIAGRFNDEVMVLGGGEVYRLAVPVADEIVLTVVLAHVGGDTHFPPLPDGWFEDAAHTRVHEADAKNAHAMVFLRLHRDASGVPFSWPSAAFAARFAKPEQTSVS